ncbi:MAG TPA: ACT domain-containing protein [Candidatus Acidoferrum sp.]|nr:ACT domain-containing protein [Candidatus Acidoferrum sp.]
MAKEAIVRLNNRVGVLAQVTKSVADQGVNIEAVIATVDGADAVIRLVSSDHQRMLDALRAQRLEAQETRVIVVEGVHRPGLLQLITEKLARENIDLLYLYATAVNVDKCLVVLSSTNNDWAVMVLNS